ncbi:hypothetical protein M2336_001044 [Sphingobium sp. B1D7B]|uniref:hypothetical protein n=1 Tax=Sphingobium sp. B1D7B TaxID=2940578 RepID=UPI002224E3FA|nr:hypothetical protein [Sphingobium sp. B1D7B]MCW2404415.1 hypothetical protein [Sphingobium sp. B1D7B]
MFKKFAFLVLSLPIFLMPTDANAGATSGYGKITQINVDAGGSAMRVEFDQPIVNPDGCGGADFYIVELNSAGKDRFMSTVLSAFMAGKSVSFWISGCTTGAYWGATRPLMSDIYVTN